MKTLRQVMQSVEPPGTTDTLRGLAAFLDVQEPVSVRQVLEEGIKYRRIFLTPLTFLQHNLALFPTGVVDVSLEGTTISFFPLYKGAERAKVLPTVVNGLQTEKPDVVGFCEFWRPDERASLRQTVSNIYPYTLEGPQEGDPQAIEFEYFDGGLLLLSRHPIVESHSTIYRQCLGEDCFTNKGILHARIQVPGHPSQYDIFFTHMQGCPPEVEVPLISNVGPGGCTDKLYTYQTMHLRDFIQAYSSPDRPALLMGDLNHDGLDQGVYAGLIGRLEQPQDIWLTAGDNTTGITSDGVGSFQADRAPRPKEDLDRRKSGSRLDYFFSWPGAVQPGRISPLYHDAEIVQWQTSTGRDLSDHYGVRCRLRCIREFEVDLNQPISSIEIWVAGFRCLRETAGPVGIVSEATGSDEIDFTVTYRAANGATKDFDFYKESVDSGEYVEIEEFKVQWDDPGSFLEIKANLDEVDIGAGIETGRVTLGPRSLRIERTVLLRYKGCGAIPRTLPIFRGDGGEYAVTVKILVK